MRRIAMVGGGAALLLWSVGIGPAGGSVRGAEEMITVSGDLVPGGTATVAGNHCLSTSSQGDPVLGAIVSVTIRSASMEVVGNLSNEPVPGLTGDWSFDVPLTADAEPGGTYTVEAGCGYSSLGDGMGFFDYPTETFVMGTGTPSEPTEPTEPTAPATPPADPPAAAPEAIAPSFTG